MPTFPKPKFQYTYNVQTEIAALRQHKATADRLIPAKQPNRLLLATWNIANFGAQERRDQDHALIAEILSWFDLIAVQEVRDNFAGLEDVRRKMGGAWRMMFSDVAGNDERMAFLYDSTKVTLLEKVGEIAFPVSQLKRVKLPGVAKKFEGFDRTPYLASFQAGQFTFLLVNVHLYFGTQAPAAKKKASIQRRSLETFGVALWADDRLKSDYCYTRDVIALGDFNMPKRDAADPIFKAITKKGLHVPVHTSKVGSNLAGDSDYDQIAFFPGETQQEFTGKHGVFDFDWVVFADLFQNRGKKDFAAYCRYYVSDHRPMWMEFKTTPA